MSRRRPECAPFQYRSPVEPTHCVADSSSMWSVTVLMRSINYLTSRDSSISVATDLAVVVYTTTHCSLKAYCAILVRRSNFCHQASPRVSPRESPAAEGETLGEKCPVILPKCRTPRYI